MVEANGDMELAIENMRKAGLAKADKKSGRIAAEGVIGVKVSDDAKTVVMVDVNCETDFVAKGDRFQAVADELLGHLFASKQKDLAAFVGSKLPSGKDVQEAIDEA